MQQIPRIVSRIVRRINGSLEEARPQRLVALVAEHGEPARHHIERIAGEHAEILIVSRNAHGKPNVDPILIAKAARRLDLLEKRIDRQLSFLAMRIEKADRHIRTFDLRKVDEHLHYDLVLVIDRCDERSVHAIGIVFALDIEHLRNELVLHHRIDARAPREHIRLDRKMRTPQRRIGTAVFVEFEHDLAFIEMRHDDHEVRCRLPVERIERKKMRRNLGAIFQVRFKRDDRISRKALDGDLRIDLAIALAHGFKTNVHLQSFLSAKYGLFGSRLGL